MRETLNILLEGTPQGLELSAIRDAMKCCPGVVDVHDLHVWSLGSNVHALATHVTIADIPPSESTAILEQLRTELRENFNIRHTTIQFEHVDCGILDDCMQSETDEHEHHHGAGHVHQHSH